MFNVILMNLNNTKIAVVIIAIISSLLIVLRAYKRIKMRIKECKYFVSAEFDSPDEKGSGKNMKRSTLLMLCKARKIADVPFRINSGYRTISHNTKVGGVTNSAHLKGYAADISTHNGKHQKKIVEALRQAGFKRFGVYNNFVHVDNDPSKKQFVAWGGKSSEINPFNHA